MGESLPPITADCDRYPGQVHDRPLSQSSGGRLAGVVLRRNGPVLTTAIAHSREQVQVACRRRRVLRPNEIYGQEAEGAV
eukprot:761482-Pyramimonas_sp.AAC.1